MSQWLDCPVCGEDEVHNIPPEDFGCFNEDGEFGRFPGRVWFHIWYEGTTGTCEHCDAHLEVSLDDEYVELIEVES